MRAWLVLIVIVLTVSCRKSQNGQPSANALDPQNREFFDYHTGSYWIFKNPTTSETDSFAVTDYQYYPTLTGPDSLAHYEAVKITISEYLLPGRATTGSLWQIVVTKNQANISFSHDGAQQIPYLVNNITQSAPMSFVAVCNDSFYTQNALLPSLSLPTQTIDSVYALYYGHKVNACYGFSQDDWLYLSRTAGLVKLEQDNYVHRVLELLRAHIVH